MKSSVTPGPLFATLTLSLGLYLVFGSTVCGWFLVIQGICLFMFPIVESDLNKSLRLNVQPEVKTSLAPTKPAALPCQLRRRTCAGAITIKKDKEK